MLDLNVTAIPPPDAQSDQPLNSADQSFLHPPESPPQFFSYAETAEIFCRSPRTIRLWVKKGLINAIRIGRTRLISKAEILRLAGQSLPSNAKNSAPADAKDGAQ